MLHTVGNAGKGNSSYLFKNSPLNSILYSERVQNNPIVATKKLLLLYMRSGEPKPDVRRSTFGLNHGNHKVPPGVVGHFQNQRIY